VTGWSTVIIKVTWWVYYIKSAVILCHYSDKSWSVLTRFFPLFCTILAVFLE